MAQEKQSLLKSLLEFQKQVNSVKKTEEGYGYKYADLEQVMNTVKPTLNDNDLVLLQTTEENVLVTQVMHAETKESIESRINLMNLKGSPGKGSEAQAYGSAVTYARRYEILTILGLAPSDDDGAGAGEPVQQTQSANQKKFDPNSEAHMKKVKNAIKGGYGTQEIIQTFKKYGLEVDEEGKTTIEKEVQNKSAQLEDGEQIAKEVANQF